MTKAAAPTKTRPAGETGLLTRIRGALTRGEWYRLSAMGGFLLLSHGIRRGTVASIASRHYSLGGAAFGGGTGLTAYTLGARHAFDADHIAAIDNTTRKLMSEGKRPLSVGLFFSLGHSTIVFALAALFAMGFRALSGPVQRRGSALHSATNLIGT